jgi:predicted RNase H-like HicB family nuclease
VATEGFIWKIRHGEGRVKFKIELEREADGRWIAEIASLPGVMVYGKTIAEAVAKVKALALKLKERGKLLARAYEAAQLIPP